MKKHKATSAPKLAAALKSIRNLLERFRGNLEGITSHDGTAEYLIMRDGLAFSFGGPEAGLYRDCRDKMLDVHGRDSQTRQLGQAAVEKLLKDALFKCLRPVRGNEPVPWKTFKRRVDVEVRNVKKQLSKAPTTWSVTLNVGGFSDRAMPLSFGGVTFVAGSASLGEEITSAAPDLAPKRRIAKRKLEAFAAARSNELEELKNRFAREVWARTEIEAGDDDAARDLALAKITTVVDVLNYFAFRFRPQPRFTPRAYVGPTGPASNVFWVAIDPSRPYLVGRPESHNYSPVVAFELGTTRSRLVGADRAHAMLQRTPTEYEDRLITALSWAGRGIVEPRRDISIICFSISLESLLKRRADRGNISERLRLRTAHLIGGTKQSRSAVISQIGRLYDIRSAFVHAGTAETISDDDVHVMRNLAILALDAVFSRKPFESMQTSAELDAWFDDCLLQVAKDSA